LKSISIPGELDAMCERITEYNRAGIDPDQCGLQPLRRAATPAAAADLAQHDLGQCAG
jgi:hypothetical protein